MLNLYLEDVLMSEFAVSVVGLGGARVDLGTRHDVQQRVAVLHLGDVLADEGRERVAQLAVVLFECFLVFDLIGRNHFAVDLKCGLTNQQKVSARKNLI